MIRRHSEIAMAPAMLLSAVISSVISLPFAHPFDITRHDLLLLLTFGFAQLGIGLALFSIGAARAPATDVALLSMLEPIMGPIWVWIFVSEYPGVPALDRRLGGVRRPRRAHVYAGLANRHCRAAARRTAASRQERPLRPAERQPLSTGLIVTPGATIASTAATNIGGQRHIGGVRAAGRVAPACAVR